MRTKKDSKNQFSGIYGSELFPSHDDKTKSWICTFSSHPKNVVILGDRNTGKSSLFFKYVQSCWHGKKMIVEEKHENALNESINSQSNLFESPNPITPPEAVINDKPQEKSGENARQLSFHDQIMEFSSTGANQTPIDALERKKQPNDVPNPQLEKENPENENDVNRYPPKINIIQSPNNSSADLNSQKINNPINPSHAMSNKIGVLQKTNSSSKIAFQLYDEVHSLDQECLKLQEQNKLLLEELTQHRNSHSILVNENETISSELKAERQKTALFEKGFHVLLQFFLQQTQQPHNNLNFVQNLSKTDLELINLLSGTTQGSNSPQKTILKTSPEFKSKEIAVETSKAIENTQSNSNPEDPQYQDQRVKKRRSLSVGQTSMVGGSISARIKELEMKNPSASVNINEKIQASALHSSNFVTTMVNKFNSSAKNEKKLFNTPIKEPQSSFKDFHTPIQQISLSKSQNFHNNGNHALTELNKNLSSSSIDQNHEKFARTGVLKSFDPKKSNLYNPSLEIHVDNEMTKDLDDEIYQFFQKEIEKEKEKGSKEEEEELLEAKRQKKNFSNRLTRRRPSEQILKSQTFLLKTPEDLQDSEKSAQTQPNYKNDDEDEEFSKFISQNSNKVISRPKIPKIPFKSSPKPLFKSGRGQSHNDLLHSPTRITIDYEQNRSELQRPHSSMSIQPQQQQTPLKTVEKGQNVSKTESLSEESPKISVNFSNPLEFPAQSDAKPPSSYTSNNNSSAEISTSVSANSSIHEPSANPISSPIGSTRSEIAVALNNNNTEDTAMTYSESCEDFDAMESDFDNGVLHALYDHSNSAVSSSSHSAISPTKTSLSQILSPTQSGKQATNKPTIQNLSLSSLPPLSASLDENAFKISSEKIKNEKKSASKMHQLDAQRMKNVLEGKENDELPAPPIPRFFIEQIETENTLKKEKNENFSRSHDEDDVMQQESSETSSESVSIAGKLKISPFSLLLEGIKIFNTTKPEEGLKFLCENSILCPDPKIIARFLVHTKNLFKSKIGELLSSPKPKNIAYLSCYCDYLCSRLYYNVDFEVSLRSFFTLIKLPPEGQQITRIVDQFSQSYVENFQKHKNIPNFEEKDGDIEKEKKTSSIGSNPLEEKNEKDEMKHDRTLSAGEIQIHEKIDPKTQYIFEISNPDDANLLGCAILMLNTSLYNPKVPPKDRISKQGFLSILNDTKIDKGYLSRVYDSIKTTQLRVLSDESDESMFHATLHSTFLQKKGLSHSKSSKLTSPLHGKQVMMKKHGHEEDDDFHDDLFLTDEEFLQLNEALKSETKVFSTLTHIGKLLHQTNFIFFNSELSGKHATDENPVSEHLFQTCDLFICTFSMSSRESLHDIQILLTRIFSSKQKQISAKKNRLEKQGKFGKSTPSRPRRSTLLFSPLSKKAKEKEQKTLEEAEERKRVHERERDAELMKLIATRIVLVGLKSDSSKTVVTFEEAENISKRFGIFFFETSAIHNRNVNELFNHVVSTLLYKYQNRTLGDLIKNSPQT